MKTINFEPDKCECCGQTTTYALNIDKGTVEIVRRIAHFIGQKGINCVHPRKEMEGRYLTSNQVGNLSRARFHGLIASIDANPGNYLLTNKGVNFLKGESIPLCAIISKAEGKQIGYFEPDKHRVKITDFSSGDPYWQGVNYEIVGGRVVRPTRPPINYQLIR